MNILAISETQLSCGSNEIRRIIQKYNLIQKWISKFRSQTSAAACSVMLSQQVPLVSAVSYDL